MYKQLNKRISVDFYDVLIQHETFKDKYKAISGAQYFLLEVAKYNDTDEGASEISSRKICELFKNYDRRGDYRKYVTALIDLGLLDNPSESYCVSRDGKDGWCKKYEVTQKGIDLISNTLKEYLKKLYYDPQVKRLSQQSISSRQIMDKSYNDYILDYICDGIRNMTFDLPVVSGVFKTIPVKSKPHTLDLLIKFRKKDFKHLKYNETDGRVWNEYVALKSDVRIASKYKDMERLFTLDIRACHPTFWALYIKEISIKYYKTTKDYIDYLTTIKSNPDSVTTYCSPESLHLGISELENEVKRYNEMFTNSILDPRKVISDATGYPYDKCKEYLNKTLNGAVQYKRLLEYLESNFPLLFNIWRNSDVKDTGKNISKMFETKLMLNPELFKLAEALNIKLIYEYDGFSLFFEPEDTEAEMKGRIIQQFINGESKKHWNLDLVLKLEPTKAKVELQNDFLSGAAAKEEIALAA